MPAKKKQPTPTLEWRPDLKQYVMEVPNKDWAGTARHFCSQLAHKLLSAKHLAPKVSEKKKEKKQVEENLTEVQKLQKRIGEEQLKDFKEKGFDIESEDFLRDVANMFSANYADRQDDFNSQTNPASIKVPEDGELQTMLNWVAFANLDILEDDSIVQCIALKQFDDEGKPSKTKFKLKPTSDDDYKLYAPIVGSNVFIAEKTDADQIRIKECNALYSPKSKNGPASGTPVRKPNWVSSHENACASCMYGPSRNAYFEKHEKDTIAAINADTSLSDEDKALKIKSAKEAIATKIEGINADKKSLCKAFMVFWVAVGCSIDGKDYFVGLSTLEARTGYWRDLMGAGKDNGIEGGLFGGASWDRIWSIQDIVSKKKTTKAGNTINTKTIDHTSDKTEDGREFGVDSDEDKKHLTNLKMISGTYKSFFAKRYAPQIEEDEEVTDDSALEELADTQTEEFDRYLEEQEDGLEDIS